jgi:hypothetical protein
MNVTQTEPVMSAAALAGLVGALLVLGASFGMPLTEEQRTAILTVVGALGPMGTVPSDPREQARAGAQRSGSFAAGRGPERGMSVLPRKHDCPTCSCPDEEPAQTFKALFPMQFYCVPNTTGTAQLCVRCAQWPCQCSSTAARKK